MIIGCASCSQENHEDSLYCVRCGTALRPEASAGQASLADREAVAGQRLAAQAKRCERCGTSNEVPAQFCHHCGWSLAAAPVLTEETSVPAGFWVRLAAYLLDGLVVIIGLVIALGVLVGLRLLGGAEGVWRNVITQAVFMLYFTLAVGLWSGTPGKLALGLRVVRTNGAKVSYLRSFFRYLAYNISALPLGLGFLWVAFSEDKRGWHDHLCDTKVIRVR